MFNLNWIIYHLLQMTWHMALLACC